MYIVQKAIWNTAGKLDEWQKVFESKSLSDCENYVYEKIGSDLDYEPSPKLEKAYFGRRGNTEWDYKIDKI